ncbi:MAG: transposase [Flavobacteriales bacterium Tduv]
MSKLGYKPREVYANKGYQVPANVSHFHSLGIKDLIQKKAYRTVPYSRLLYYSLILVSKNRWVVEGIFSKKKCWFGSEKNHYKGLVHVYTQPLI